ncbi:ABC transporter permease [Natronolimnobius sp. AArcel1]|uniref:ABC transporter permease subunit n=1 Tax=Natronolimnobius sp. AArcel1 TaxID=1679093 RepID=UPI0013EC5F78|nr:ABC transporter permease subunit [Natronolimnobius sp. AArcel1]NGM70091.1 ABC transporter permease [Natronolimnobius sp. AArcel1]
MVSHIATVARKDFDDASRSKLLWALIGLLVGMVAIGYAGIWYVVDDASASEVLGFLGFPLQTLVPIAALITGYMAVVGERRSGSIKLLLGLPPNRADVVFGKLLGRAAVIGTAIALAFITALVLSSIFFGAVPLFALVEFGLLTLLFGVAFVSFAVGVSAAVSTRGKSMAIVVGSYMLFVALWELVTAGPYRLLYGEGPGTEPATWYLVLEQLNPLMAYTTLATEIVEGTIPPFTFQYGLESFEASQLTPAERYAGEAPFYLQEWFGIVVLLGWLLVPALIGYYRFSRADL